MHPLRGKVALVTGASVPRGIGRAIALRLAQDGAAVFVTDIDGIMDVDGIPMQRPELLQRIVTEIVGIGGAAFSLILDVSDVSAEDDPSYTTRPRIDAWGGDTERIRVLSGRLAFDDEGLKTLRAELDEYEPDLIITDPWCRSFQLCPSSGFLAPMGA